MKCKDCDNYHESIGWCDKYSYWSDEDGNDVGQGESDYYQIFRPDDYCESSIGRNIK